MAAFLTPWRWAAALVLVGVVGVPLLMPLAELTRLGALAWSPTDWQRLSNLFVQTLGLIAGTLALALPIGTALALLLFRFDLPGRRLGLGLTLLMLFVPTPMIASAWQAFFGSDGWLHLALWGDNAGRPWTTGMAPAIWVHFLAGLPWVIFLVGLGLTWVERELEEDGLLRGPPWWVVFRITLPRCRAAIGFASVWLALQVAGEITVTDMMLVSTFAEEVQIQLTTSDRTGVARAVLAALPLILATWALLAWYATRLDRLPPLQLRLADPRRFPLGRWRWPSAGATALVLLMFFGVPLASLLWKLGQAGHPPRWSAANAWGHFANAWQLHAGFSWGASMLWKNLTLAGATGVAVTLVALVLCWLADESRGLRRLIVLLLALAWAVPGPVIGIGLKETIALLPDGILADLFYYGPSPLPLMWAYTVRFLPFAMVMLWPVVRLVPREPREAARLEGQGPWREFRTVVWPLSRRGVWLTSALVAALCLGEVAATARVETPDFEGFSKVLFDRMHYGVDNNVAALSVVMLVGIVAGAAFGTVCKRALRTNSRSSPTSP